jgi:hypothetical protein
MTRGTWQEQYDRTRRWYERFAEIHSGKEHDRSSDNYRDDVHAFFVNCYHLKDWLYGDTASGLSKDAVERAVQASLDLRLCGDLANGVKHMKLSRTPRVSKDTALGRTAFALDVASGQIRADYEVSADGQTYDAFEIATRALVDWDAFLTVHGLLPTV